MEKIFADGVIFKRSDKAPDFVVGNLSIKVSDFAKFVKQYQTGEWINFQIKKGREGKCYVELDTWKPEGKQQSEPLPPQPPQRQQANHDYSAQMDFDPEKDDLPF